MHIISFRKRKKMSHALLFSCNLCFDHLRQVGALNLLDCMHDRVHLAFDMVEGGPASVGKPPIVLLHGMSQTKETWQDVIHPIAEATHRKVYALDARNHGDSGWSENLNIQIMKQDLLQFMDCLHFQKAILIGHSMGGKVSMSFATTWPDRVEKLIVEDTSPRSVPKHLIDYNVKYKQRLHDSIEKIPSNIKDLQEAKNFVYEFLQGIETKDDPRRQNTNRSSSLPLYQDESGRFKWKTNLKALEPYLESFYKPHRVTGLYPGPMLMLYGTLSPFKVSADWDFIKRVFPEAQLKAIEGASHQVHEEYPDVFVKEVVDFITES